MLERVQILERSALVKFEMGVRGIIGGTFFPSRVAGGGAAGVFSHSLSSHLSPAHPGKYLHS